MPFRADAPFLRDIIKHNERMLPYYQYQCPFGLMLHFHVLRGGCNSPERQRYQCPLGLKLHFYRKGICSIQRWLHLVSMPSRAVASFLRSQISNKIGKWVRWVSMPSRADAPFLLGIGVTLAIVAVLGINALSGWDSISTKSGEL